MGESCIEENKVQERASLGSIHNWSFPFFFSPVNPDWWLSANATCPTSFGLPVMKLKNQHTIWPKQCNEAFGLWFLSPSFPGPWPWGFTCPHSAKQEEHNPQMIELSEHTQISARPPPHWAVLVLSKISYRWRFVMESQIRMSPILSLYFP